MLLTIGGTFFLGFGPVMLVIFALFLALYIVSVHIPIPDFRTFLFCDVEICKMECEYYFFMQSITIVGVWLL